MLGALRWVSIFIMRYSNAGTKLVDEIYGVKTNPGAKLTELLKNYPYDFQKPQGMPDADSKGEYPNTGNGSVVPPPMPDYDPNKPYDKYPNGGGTGSPQFPWDMESKRINFCKLRDNDCRCSISTL